MSEEEIQLTEEQKTQQAGKNLADVVARGAASYYGGALGNKAYNAAAKTQFVQNRLEHAGNKLSKSPVLKNERVQNAISDTKPMLDQSANSLSSGNSKLDSADSMMNNSSLDEGSSSMFALSSLFKSSKGTTKENGFSIKKTKIWLKIIPPIAMFLLIIFIILILVSTIVSGFEYISDTISTTKDKLFNFLSGCGWSTVAECNAKEQNDFYEEIEVQYEHYLAKYDIKIDKNLLVATLTYNNPFLTSTSTDELSGSTMIDFKKGKKHVKDLVKHMVVETRACYVVKDDITNGFNCDQYDEYKAKVGTEGITKVFDDTKYVLDLEKYRQYLDGTLKGLKGKGFILKYYFDNKLTDENQEKVLKITEEIYQRVEMYEYLTKNEIPVATLASNNAMVAVTDCAGVVEEQMTVTEYLEGVVYMNYDGSSEEYLKYVAMAAKNHLYSQNNVSIDNMSQNLRIQNCSTAQLSCSITKGCHYVSIDEETQVLKTGAGGNNEYYKLPISDAEVLASVKKAVSDTISDFLIEDGQIVYPKDWYLRNQEDIKNQLLKVDYKTLLVAHYGGTIDSINLFATGYPLDLKWNNVTSGYGWRIHPIQKICKHHNGTDIAANRNSNIYSIADGVVTYKETNYGTTGYGNYVVIGHGQKINGYYEYYSLYAHQVKTPPVEIGHTVKAGEVIGYVGSTGSSTGNHLHIEVYTYVNGQKVRQDPVVSFKNVQLTGVVGPMFTSESQCLLNR